MLMAAINVKKGNIGTGEYRYRGNKSTGEHRFGEHLYRGTPVPGNIGTLPVSPVQANKQGTLSEICDSVSAWARDCIILVAILAAAIFLGSLGLYQNIYTFTHSIRRKAIKLGRKREMTCRRLILMRMLCRVSPIPVSLLVTEPLDVDVGGIQGAVTIWRNFTCNT